jgi:16S rRNA (guanine527-N7)-methyltransferase
VPDRPAEPDRAGALVAAAGSLGVTLSPAQAERLLAFAAMLERANKAINLVSRQDVARLVPRHLLDSLSVAPLLPAGRVMDLGTGGGLPGVPLAIAREDVRFTLVDRSERKIRFVSRAVRELGLDNVTVLCGDAVELTLAPFDAVVSRAVTSPGRLWAMAEPRLAAGGIVVVMYRADDQGGDGAPALPGDVEILVRRKIDIPGLSRSHEILVLARAGEHPGQAELARGGTRSAS